MIQYISPHSTSYSHSMFPEKHPIQARINSILLSIENQFVYSLLNDSVISEINALIQQKVNEPFNLYIKALYDGGSLVRLTTTDGTSLKVLSAYNAWHSQMD